MIPALLLPLWLLVATRDSSSLQDPRIVHIRNLFLQVQNDSSIHKITLDGPAFLGEEASTTKGILTGYFKGDTLCKVSTKVGMNYAVFQENYYFEKGQLIYADELEKDFPPNADHTGLNHTKPVWAFEGTYYFEGYKAFSVHTEGKRKVSEDEIHHPLELYHNAAYYYGLLMKQYRAHHPATARSAASAAQGAASAGVASVTAKAQVSSKPGALHTQ